MTDKNPTSARGRVFAASNRRVLAIVAGLSLVAAACGGSVDGVDDEAGTDRESIADLGRCPDPLVIQTDWYPRPEQGALYALAAGQGGYDADNERFRGPLAVDPDHMIEIRAGGPALDDRTALEAMIDDEEIFLASVDTDEAIANNGQFPTTAVVALLDISPRMLMWDPETYEIESWADVADLEATISHAPGLGSIDYLLAAGLVDGDQLADTSDGSSTRFVAQDGELIQQGQVTREPYIYESVLADWGRPVESLMIHDAGYEIYHGPLAVLDDRLDTAARACLAALVPLIQQSIIDFQRDPTVTNDLLVEIADPETRALPLTDDGALASVVEMGSLGIVGNGSNGTVGDFDFDRVLEIIEIIALQVDSVDVDTDLTVEDLVSNEFIDPDLGL